MYKEIIICIIIVVLIIIGNIITQNNTQESIEEMKASLFTLKEEISKEKVDKEKIGKSMEKAKEIWEKENEKMAYYIEHNELEKVGTELSKIGGNIETEEYKTGVENIESCSFVLEHIKDKNALKIVNIF